MERLCAADGAGRRADIAAFEVDFRDREGLKVS
jgi:hypothetical protein